MCHIADDSDDEEMDANLNKYDAAKDDSVGAYQAVEEVTGPTFDESDEEDEEEEEEVVEKPPTPKKKKKIVRRKVKKSSGD
jgi:hypothetical protein